MYGKRSAIYFIGVYLILISFTSCKKEPDACPWCPQVNLIIPSAAAYDDTVFIAGKYLLPNPDYNDVLQVRFNGVAIPQEYILESYDDSIRLIVPKGVTSGPVTVDLNEADGLIGTKSADFTYIYTPYVTTLAGNGVSAVIDNPVALDASFQDMTNITINPVTNELYIHDLNTIRAVSKLNGVQTVTSSVSNGNEIASDNYGNVFWFDLSDYTMKIRDFQFGWTFNYYAGTPNVNGIFDSTLTTSTFNLVLDMKFNSQNNMIFSQNEYVRRINTSDSVVTTIAGTSSGYQDGPVATAKFTNVWAVEPTSDGSIFLADYDNHVIRRIKTGQVTTIAGIPSQPGFSNSPNGLNATMAYPESIAFDGKSKLYFTDQSNCIRAVDLITSAVTVLAGDSTANGTNAGYVDGDPYEARFDSPTKIAFNKNLNRLYILDTGNNVIREIIFE